MSSSLPSARESGRLGQMAAAAADVGRMTWAGVAAAGDTQR